MTYITKGIDSTEEMNEQWSKAVGRAILGFGNIEWVTYQCLGMFPSDRIFESVVSLRFSHRVDLIVEILSGKNLPTELFERVETLFGKAKKCAETRSLIAHNPLRVGVYEDDEGNLHLRDEIQHYRKTNKVLTLDEIRTYGEEVETLEDEFMGLIGDIRQQLTSNN